jgi:hypothetical protein
LILVTPTVLGGALHHHAHLGGYLNLVWLAASLATTGGALGAALESDGAVREAAYSYRATTVGRRVRTPELDEGSRGGAEPASTG